MKKIVFTISFVLFMSCPILVNAKASNKPNENFANLVFFAYYDGTSDEIKEDQKYYEDKSTFFINLYDGSNKRNFTNYLKEISYGKFNAKNIFPQVENGVIKPLKLNINIADSYARNNDTELMEQIVNAYPSIHNQIVDYNNDGCIDNLTIIIKDRAGYTAANHSTFVSHKGDYPGTKKYLNKEIVTYNIVNTASIENSHSGVITHEFLHSLGYPDLYRSETTEDYPVHVWDIMASANPGMSYPLTYLRKAITNWVDIETVTENKTLRLDLQSNKDGNQAYILKSPLNDYEYFVVEYRKKEYGVSEDILDRYIGGSGVIVYRVDTTVEGYSNNYGKTGVYVFRPQKGFDTEQSKAYNAFLSVESGRTSIGTSDLSLGLTDGALTFTDGSNSGIVIKNVSKTDGDYMTLDVEIPKAENFDLWKNKNLPDLIGGTQNTNKNIAITQYKNKLYALSYGNNKVYTQVLENNQWVTKGTNSNIKTEVLTNMKLVELNHELYLIANHTNTINVYKWNDTNNTWNSFSSYPETLNEFDVNVINNKIYIAGSTSDKAILYVLNNNAMTKVGTYYSGVNGTPKIGEMNDKIYVSVKNMNGNLLLYQYEANQFNPINTGINANNYDLKFFHNKLYIVLGTDLNNQKMSLKKYDGNNWETISSSIALSFPNMVVSQGNLYILGTDHNNLYTYSYDEDHKKFTMEGTVVDTGSSSYDTSLVSLNNTIYVGIKKVDNTLLVKAKEMVNSLMSISITPPKKVTYVIGEKLDKTGLKVIANYKKEQKEISNYTITNFNTNQVGSYRATITYEGVSSTFAYTVIDKNNSSNTGNNNNNSSNTGNNNNNSSNTGNNNNNSSNTGNNNNNNSSKIKNGNYVIRSALNNNKVLDVQGGSNKKGTNVQLYDYNASNAQVWNITYLKDGYYKITSHVNNQLVLDVSGAKKNNGANVQVYSNNNSNAQQWLIKDTGDGYYYLISRCNNLHLDIAAGQTKNGTNIQMYKGNKTKAQKFKLEQLDKTIENGNYVIKSALNNKKVLDVQGGSNKKGTNVQLYDYNASHAQIWNITYLKDGYYKITSHINNKLALDVSGAKKNNGANVQVYNSNNSKAQQWFIKEAGNGYYYLISRCNVLTLDVASAKTKNGTNIQMYRGNSSKAQKFKLEKKV